MNITNTTFSLCKRVKYKMSLIRNNSTKSSADYCINLVKSHDYENFISTILLKSMARASAFAVRSFNVEVAKVAEQVSQKEIGLMRMKFWEDTVDKCFLGEASKVPQHPVAQELFKILNQSKLSKRHFTNLISSRKDYFNVNGFKTLDDMEKYAEKSVSSVYYLILEGCDIRNVNADHAASHLGKAQGIVQQLRNILHTQRLKFVSIPQEILTKNNVNHEALIRGKSSQELSDCVYEVASRAHQHLTLSRQLTEKLPPQTCSILLPAVAVFSYLDRLQKVDYDVFHKSLQHRSWDLLPKIWWSSFNNKF